MQLEEMARTSVAELKRLKGLEAEGGVLQAGY